MLITRGHACQDDAHVYSHTCVALQQLTVQRRRMYTYAHAESPSLQFLDRSERPRRPARRENQYGRRRIRIHSARHSCGIAAGTPPSVTVDDRDHGGHAPTIGRDAPSEIPPMIAGIYARKSTDQIGVAEEARSVAR